MHTQDSFLTDINLEPRRPNPRRYQTQRGTGQEAQDVKRRLGNFNAASSPMNRLLSEYFPDATKNELISVAQITIMLVHQRFQPGEIPESFNNFDRVTRRSKDLIIKWYHDHWNIIKDFFGDVGLADANYRPISKHAM